MKFKVGDKVTILDTNRAQVDLGDVGKVVSWTGDGEYRVVMDAPKPRFKGTVWFFNEGMLKLAENTQEKQMPKTTVHYLYTNGSITLQYNGKTHLIAKVDERFEKVMAAIRAGKLEEIPEIVDGMIAFKKAGIEVEEGLLKVKGQAMPPELNSRIMEYKRQGIPYKSLLNFWTLLQSNPSFNCRTMLFDFLNKQNCTLTEDGHFIGYRGVRDDFKDKHTGTMDNTPGQVVKMARELVDDNPKNSCSHGLHIGGFDYAKSFGPKLVIVKVNPANVVAVPDAYQGNKLRVCEFEVLSEAQAKLESTVVNAKGQKIEAFEDEDDMEADMLEKGYEPLNLGSKALANVAKRQPKRRPTSAIVAEAKTLRATANKQARYANNHAKRDKTGKFTAKRK